MERSTTVDLTRPWISPVVSDVGNRHWGAFCERFDSDCFYLMAIASQCDELLICSDAVLIVILGSRIAPSHIFINDVLYMNHFVELTPQRREDFLLGSGEDAGHPMKRTLYEAGTLKLAHADFSFIFAMTFG